MGSPAGKLVDLRALQVGKKSLAASSGASHYLRLDSCIFLIFTTRVGLKTRLNEVKSIRFEQCRKF
jgi:hypothetical protein